MKVTAKLTVSWDSQASSQNTWGAACELARMIADVPGLTVTLDEVETRVTEEERDAKTPRWPRCPINNLACTRNCVRSNQAGRTGCWGPGDEKVTPAPTGAFMQIGTDPWLSSGLSVSGTRVCELCPPISGYTCPHISDTDDTEATDIHPERGSREWEDARNDWLHSNAGTEFPEWLKSRPGD